MFFFKCFSLYACTIDYTEKFSEARKTLVFCSNFFTVILLYLDYSGISSEILTNFYTILTFYNQKSQLHQLVF